MEAIITVCARGGSKGVKGKNVRIMADLPLIAHTLRQAKTAGLFDAFAVSSDSTEILSIAESEGFIPIMRPEEMASDTAAKIPVIRHCVEAVEEKLKTKFKYCIDLDCTSPLRSIEDIRAVYDLIKRSEVPNVITAMPARRSPYFNMVERDLNGQINLVKRPNPPLKRRQDAPACYDLNASIYAWKREVLHRESGLFLEGTVLYEMPEERSIDIDSELDFEIVNMLMNKRHL
jgi:CMP-N,N'-diacetyllegionaminic acid synthase